MMHLLPSKTTLACLALALMAAVAPVRAFGDVTVPAASGGSVAGGNDGVGGIERKAKPKTPPVNPGVAPAVAPPAGWVVVPPTANGDPLNSGAWTDLGQGLSASDDESPRLTWLMYPSVPGLHGLFVSQGRPAAMTWFVLGLGVAEVPFRGGVLVPTPDLVFAGLSLDADGALLIPVAADPASLPLGLVLQAWIDDPSGPQGLTATNGAVVVAP